MNDSLFAGAHVGIAHTRWATHGGVSVENAHPHTGPQSKIMIVHNGIIENYEVLKKEIDSTKLTGQTDTEVLAHYIEKKLDQNTTLRDTLFTLASQVHGAWNIVCLRDTGELCAVRNSAQILVVGMSDEGVFVGSDEQALPVSVTEIYEIPHGYMCDVSADLLSIYDKNNIKVLHVPRTRAVFPVEIIEGEMMAREIRKQDETLGTLVLGMRNQESVAQKIYDTLQDITVNDIIITACGTSYNAGLAVARAWEEAFQKPVSVVIASEMESVVRDLSHTVVVAVSQSGSTQDVLDAIAHVRTKHVQTVIAVTNKQYSSIKEKSDILFDVCAGPEFGVASTKAFTHTLVSMLYLAQKITVKDAENCIPMYTQVIVSTDTKMKMWAQHFCTTHTILYLGKHGLYPIAVEGALKIKEISYIHAESFAAGELKHGPIALVESGVPVLVLLRADDTEDLVRGSIREVEARGAKVYVIAEEGIDMSGFVAEQVSIVPKKTLLYQVIFTIPLQLLAYYAAKVRGLDPDKPRNLAKSVTVK